MILTISLQVFLLVFTRILAIFMFLPVFGSNNIPLQIRVLFIAFVSLAMMQFVKVTTVVPQDMMVFGGFLLLEFLVGLSIGFIGLLITNGIYLAGLLIDMSVGFAMTNVVGVQDESEVPVTANFLYLLAMTIFLVLDFHHEIIKAIIKSYEMIPIGTFNFNFFVVNHFFAIAKETFEIGFQISAPILITIMVMDLILGILSKAMPGMNIFTIGMPFKILVGLITLYLIMPYIQNIFVMLFHKMIEYMNQLIFILKG